jgi:hypothetical protein
VSEVIDDDHLQELKDDVRPLLKGESVMRLLQQDANRNKRPVSCSQSSSQE